MSATYRAPITISSGTYINVTGSTLTLSAAAPGVSNIAGQTGSLNKLGVGTLALTTADTYTGSTVVSAGTLSLAATGSILGTSDLTVGPAPRYGSTIRAGS